MKDLLSFFQSFFNNIPISLLMFLLSAYLIIIILMMVMRCSKEMITMVSLGLALIEYVIVIMLATVFFRPISAEYQSEMIPFWSYNRIINGDMHLLRANILNTLLFIPIGLLLCGITNGKRWLLPVILAASLSVFIELMQYVFRRGLFEFDDIFHNTLGCLLGFFFIKLFSCNCPKGTARML